MLLAELAAGFMTPARAKAMRSALKGGRVTTYGLAGSSAGVSSSPKKSKR